MHESCFSLLYFYRTNKAIDLNYFEKYANCKNLTLNR